MALLLINVENNLVRRMSKEKYITHEQANDSATYSPITQTGRIEFNAALIEKLREASLGGDTIALVIERDTADGYYLDPGDSTYPAELKVMSLKHTLRFLGIKLEHKIYNPSEAQELTTSENLTPLAPVEPEWQSYSHYNANESLAHRYVKTAKAFSANGTHPYNNYLISLLNQECFSRKRLVDALCKIPLLQYAFDLSAGLNPEISVRYHTEEVLRVMQEHKEQVEKRFRKFGMGMQSAALFFALHDIGKGIAKASLTNATKSDENQFTIAILKPFCDAIGYAPEIAEVFIQVLENDFMGEYLTSTLDSVQAVKIAQEKIINIRNKVNAQFREKNRDITVTAEDVYFLGKIYHQVDAGAYNHLRSDKTHSNMKVIFSGQKNDTGQVKLQYTDTYRKKASLLHASVNEALNSQLKKLQKTVDTYQDKIQSKQNWAGLRYFGDLILRVLAFPFVDLVRLINQGRHYEAKGRPTLIAEKLRLIKVATASVKRCTADSSAKQLELNLAELKKNLSALDADNISASKQWLFTSVKKEAGGNLHQTLQAAQTTIDEIQTILKNRKPAPV